MSNAIEVRSVSKRFRLYQDQYSSLTERILHGGKVPFDEFWALKDVSFEVEEGTTFGLLGHNGSGKSTLLKAIAGITHPTSGEIVTRGRVTALLELGAGFQSDLSGRDNIYLNASLVGLSKSYVDRCFDDIVDFAELAPFIDNQVKYYSSGMYVRLGFAVAVYMDPDILIVDEVLAVGDELFQRKCIERVKQFQAEGRTIVVVTHSADQVRQICSQAAVLDHGNLVGLGTPPEVIRSFREHLLRRQAFVDAQQLDQFIALDDDGLDSPEPAPASGDGNSSGITLHGRRDHGLTITSVRFESPDDPESTTAMTGRPFTIRVGYHAERRFDDVLPGFTVYDHEGRFLFGANTKLFPAPSAVDAGDGEFVFELESVPLLDGDYPVTVGLLTEDEGTVYDWREQEYLLSVMSPGKYTGLLLVPTKIGIRQSSGDPLLIERTGT
ncbi:MAG: ABC transporter ATP-binding protein [Acidimicrobiales bacterium]